jgi:catechol-2,3-dioxygenase
MQLKWAHQVMYVHDMENMIDFYTKVLGFEVQDRGPIPTADGMQELVFMSQVPTDHHQIALQGGRAKVEPSNSVNHNAFRVSSFDDVKEMARRIKEDGRSNFILPLSHGNAWSVYFSDPEGNGLEVFVDSPFHVQQPAGKPWNLEMSEAEMREQTIKDYGDQPEFGPIDAYYARRAREIEGR